MWWNVLADDKLTWQGKSGSKYRYNVHEISWRPSKDQDGNYVFAKLEGDIWYAVYVGQGDLQSRYDAALDEGCVTRKGATHYHAHLNNDKDARIDEEKDIINGNPECKWPVGGNDHD